MSACRLTARRIQNHTFSASTSSSDRQCQQPVYRRNVCTPRRARNIAPHISHLSGGNRAAEPQQRRWAWTPGERPRCTLVATGKQHNGAATSVSSHPTGGEARNRENSVRQHSCRRYTVQKSFQDFWRCSFAHWTVKLETRVGNSSTLIFICIYLK